ncbi:MAG: family 10 glycosylhydrolase [Planctomycetota bacterium]
MLRRTLLTLVFTACLTTRAPAQTTETLPEPPREFRAMWVATVKNIDWPNAEDRDSPSRMRAHMHRLLDTAEQLNMHAVLFQARPTADALYASDLEPWSEWLTGAQGRAPNGLYDPLAEWTEACHERGLELHVWLNPYRARHRDAKTPMAAPHLAIRRPDLVHTHGDYQWIDPGEPDAKEHVMRIMRDVVTRYDVDGLVFDDYFYPYPVDGVEFPDHRAWSVYQRSGGDLTRADWRRRNVDRLITRMRKELRAIRPDLIIGVSPFGIWRPNNPPGVIGFDAYDKLYADARRWLREGWIDYLAPQLYWPIDSKGQPFEPLLVWWERQNTAGRRVYVAQYTSRIRPEGEATQWEPAEIIEQIKVMRHRSKAPGQIHFSAIALEHNHRGVADALRKGPYRTRSLPPRIESADLPALAAPNVTLANDSALVRAEWTVEGDVRQWVVWSRRAGDWSVQVLPLRDRSIALSREINGRALEALAVAAVGPGGSDGPPRIVRLD